MLLTCSHISHTLALLQSIKDYRQIKQAQDREMLRDLPQKDAASGGGWGEGERGRGGAWACSRVLHLATRECAGIVFFGILSPGPGVA